MANDLTNKAPAIFVVLGVLGLLASSSFFVVSETDQALVVRLGEVQRQIRDAGLNWKMPLIDNVVYYDKRVLDLSPKVEQVILSDQKRLQVDAFVRWRIQDGLKFRQAVGSEAAAEQRLSSLTTGALRRVLGSVPMTALLSAERTKITQRIKDELSNEAINFGIEIVDARIRRADLPEQNSQAIFERMRSERLREAKDARARGEEVAQVTRAQADREKTVLLSAAMRDAQKTRGEGDKQASEILAKAYSRDPAFFSFYRSLEAYRNTMANKETTLVLSPETSFFHYFDKFDGKSGK